jgi:hypothetical protein
MQADRKDQVERGGAVFCQLRLAQDVQVLAELRICVAKQNHARRYRLPL